MLKGLLVAVLFWFVGGIACALVAPLVLPPTTDFRSVGSLISFALMIIGGGFGLYVALDSRNNSKPR